MKILVTIFALLYNIYQQKQIRINVNENAVYTINIMNILNSVREKNMT